MARALPTKKKKIAPLSEAAKLKKRIKTLSQKLSASVPREEMESRLKDFSLWKSRSRKLNKSKIDKLQSELGTSQSRVRTLESEGDAINTKLNHQKDEADKKIIQLEEELRLSGASVESERATIGELEQAKEELERKFHLLESRILELEGMLGGMIPREELDKSMGRTTDLEKELSQVRTDLYSARSKASELEANNSQLELRLEGSISKEEYDDRITELNSKLAELQARVTEGTASQEEINQCKKRVEELENDLAMTKDALVRSTTG